MLSTFGERCATIIEDERSDIDESVEEVPQMLSDNELHSIHPISRLLAPLLQYCRRKTEEQVVKTVARVAPLLSDLIDRSKVRRFKVQVLCEAQRIAYDMGLPRLSPS